jgi:hypothetical protein
MDVGGCGYLTAAMRFIRSAYGAPYFARTGAVASKNGFWSTSMNSTPAALSLRAVVRHALVPQHALLHLRLATEFLDQHLLGRRELVPGDLGHHQISGMMRWLVCA